MRPHVTLSVLTVLLAAALPRDALAQQVRTPIVEPETIALGAKRSGPATHTPMPVPGIVGGADPATLLRRATDPLPARSLTTYLCGEARDAIMQGMMMADGDAQERSYMDAERDARQALALDPASLEARYWLAAAEGMRAGFGGLGHRLRLGGDVYHLAQSILDTDPVNAGGHYLMGRLNFQIMKMSGLSRFIAANLLGADLIRQASWEQAESHLLAAVRREPRNALDRLTLARVYAATGRDARARAQLDVLFRATDRTPITPLLEAQGQALLRSLPESR